MCLNKKRFYNKWNHTWQWVDCGKCPACMQAKANKRTMRIRNAVYDGYITLFVTLTYRNINIPYIRKDEIKENSPYFNIYRDCSVRRVRFNGSYQMVYRYKREREIIGKYDCFKYRLFPDISDVQSLPRLKGQSNPNKVGVIFYKDVQDFEKRLRINLLRHYGIKKAIYTFKCSEYGPSTFRPHFHLLISVPQESLAQCKSAITEAWPYDSRVKSDKSIEIARNAASYVSSYVNRGSDFPRFLDNARLRPKHSFSLGYGLQNNSFSLEYILQQFHRRDIRYTSQFYYNDFSFTKFVPIPKYACNRYFAKCYGYSRLTYDEIIQLCKDPYGYVEKSDLLPRFFRTTSVVPLTHTLVVNSLTQDYDYDWAKVRVFCDTFLRLRSRFCRDFVYYEDNKRYQGLPQNDFSFELFGDYYYRFWNVYNSTLLRSQYEDITDVKEIPYLFENWDEVYTKNIRSDILTFVDTNFIHYKDHKLDGVLATPSLFARNVNQSLKMTSRYNSLYKRRKLVNRVMSVDGFNV